MKNFIITAGIAFLGTAAMAQTTAPVTDKGNNLSTVARETESAPGKGAIVSAEARKQKTEQISGREKRAELKAANAAPRSEEARAAAETRKATAGSTAKTVKSRPGYAGNGAAAARPVRLAKPVKPARAVKG